LLHCTTHALTRGRPATNSAGTPEETLEMNAASLRNRVTARVALFLLVTSTVHVPPAHALDPLVPQQWHLKSRLEEEAGANVVDAWALSQGAGVVVGVVDDGLDHGHPDLVQNFSSLLSRDFDDGDADPSPLAVDGHGTAVAGLIAARGDNGIGVSGVAPLATLAGLRLNADGVTPTDSRDAAVFAHELDRIHVLNNSWAPGIFNRPGAYAPAGPGPLAQAAIERAVAEGRGGRGRIFVWAAGNRGNEGKDCNQNGYANSRFGIAVGAYADFGQQSWFSEPCAALFVTAPSNGGSRGLTTTDNTGASGVNAGDYRAEFGGTSGATAITSGIIALMLSRNPSLTWRDVKHILARTAVRVNASDPGWTSGLFPHNPRYGFGLVDAVAAVQMASTWTSVAPEAAVPEVRRTLDVTIPDGASSVGDAITVGSAFSGFKVEHVEVVLDASHPRRGDLEVTLTSPAGVTSRLASAWSAAQGADYTAWRFGSVRHWGESAAGTWQLTVADRVTGEIGILHGWTLRIYGTTQPPAGLSASFVRPADGATVSGVTPIEVAASGVSGPATFSVAIDGVPAFTTTITGSSATWNWDTSTVANGSHTLALTVTSEGRTATATAGVTVANASFTAAWSYPAEGAKVTGTIGLGMKTTAPWGRTKTFELSVDDAVVMTAVTTGTTVWWNWDSRTVASGARTLTLRVTYNGETATAVRHVTVSNTTTSTPALTASFTAPAAGATVSGTTSVGLAWSGASAPYSYSLAIDGTTVASASVTGTSATYAWNTTTATNGTHTLTLTVTAGGQTATSSRSVTVSNGTSPAPLAAAFTAPAAGATVSGTTTVGMAASGGATSSYTYTLAVDGTTVSTQTLGATSASYAWNTASVANGSHTLTLTVTSGSETATVTRTVTVNNATVSFTASLTYPAENATVRGLQSIGMSTTAPWGKTKTFTLSASGTVIVTITTTGTTAWHRWDSTIVPNGPHILRLDVTYNGQTAVATRAVTVAN
jgi:subtilisin-like proprotein convertase family protein